MSWLALIIIAVIGDSTRIFLDNYSTDVFYKGRGANAQKLFFGYAHVIVWVLLGVIFGFGLDKLSWGMILNLLVSGILSSVAGIFYYKALEIDDSTNLTIFIQLAPILYLIMGWIFMGESISLLQMLAFLVILMGPTLIILTTRKRSRKTKMRAVFIAGLYVLISVFGNLIFTYAAKYSSGEISFVTTMLWMLLGKGVANLAIVYANRKLVRRWREVFKKSHGKVLQPLMVNEIVYVVKDFAYRGALVVAPAVAVASAVGDSAEPIVTFLLGVVLTLIWPKFGREKLNRKSVMVHLAATILVVIGVILIQ